MMRCDFTSDEEFYEAIEEYKRQEEQEYYEMEYWLSLANEANKANDEEQKEGYTNE